MLQVIAEGKKKGFSVDTVLPYNTYLRCLKGNINDSLEGKETSIKLLTLYPHHKFSI